MKNILFLFLLIMIFGTLSPQNRITRDGLKKVSGEKQQIKKPVDDFKDVLLHENFENADFPPDGWTITDQDGDGFNWQRSTSNEGITVIGTACATSQSYDFASDQPLAPDNYLISPAVDLSGITGTITLEWQIFAQDPGWPAEHYKVVVSTTDDQVTSFSDSIFEETLTAASNFMERSVDLTNYSGQTIYIAWVHYNVSNQFLINLDEIVLSTSAGVNDVNSANLISIYPNPTNGKVNINNVENSVINIYNILGEVVKSYNNTSKFTSLDLSELNQGVFFVKIFMDNNIVATQKIILTK